MESPDETANDPLNDEALMNPTSSTGIGQGSPPEKIHEVMPAIRPAGPGTVSGLVPVQVPVPTAGPDDVLVRVVAAAVNRSDALAWRGVLPGPFPRVLGRTFAGDVVRGPHHLLGRRVWASGGGDIGISRDGGHAQYIATSIATVAEIPVSLSYTDAAASALAYFTAAAAIHRAGGLSADITIVATGAAGGVGGAAASLAQWNGARVIRIVRGPSSEMPLGDADQIVRSDLEDVSEAILRLTDGRGADLAIDAVGGQLTVDVLKGLCVGGRLCLVSSPPAAAITEIDLLDFYRRELLLVGLHTGRLAARDSAVILSSLADGFDSGVLRPTAVYATYPLKQASAAYAEAEQEVRGRPVLRPFP